MQPTRQHLHGERFSKVLPNPKNCLRNLDRASVIRPNLLQHRAVLASQQAVQDLALDQRRKSLDILRRIEQLKKALETIQERVVELPQSQPAHRVIPSCAASPSSQQARSTEPDPAAPGWQRDKATQKPRATPCLAPEGQPNSTGNATPYSERPFFQAGHSFLPAPSHKPSACTSTESCWTVRGRSDTASAPERRSASRVRTRGDGSHIICPCTLKKYQFDDCADYASFCS